MQYEDFCCGRWKMEDGRLGFSLCFGSCEIFEDKSFFHDLALKDVSQFTDLPGTMIEKDKLGNAHKRQESTFADCCLLG